MFASNALASAAGLGIARREELLARLLEHLDPALVGCEMERRAETEEGVRPCLSGHSERERLVVEAGRAGERVQREGAVAGALECCRRGRGEHTHVDTGRARELERRRIVVGEQVAVVVGTAERFDPLGSAAVALGARGPRGRAVRDVPYQHMPERVLAFARDRAAPLPADELAALERMQPLFDGEALGPADRGECPRPEHFADDGRVLEQALVLGREPIEARRDDALNGPRQLEVGAVAL
jgi:hypothetical protein